ncbi:hypothetical protein RAZWK3B_14753 [Roseobacter sp. AzwK-3b]|nr:hypothetical protein RAZWK3B_14753 [Roseobacter sp. AzwK-3b]
MKMKIITAASVIMMLETGLAFASDRFSMDGNVLIYDTTFPPETVAEGILPDDQSQKSDDAVAAATSDKEDEDSDSVEYSDVTIFHEILAERSNIEAVKLTSDGGSPGAGYQIGRIINDYGLDTVADRECISACTFVFLGGNNRSMTKGSRLGFHHLDWGIAEITEFYERMRDEMGWNNPFEFTEWAYREGQRDANILLSYFIAADVSPDFALDILERGDERIWYPDRNTLETANVLRSETSGAKVAQQDLDRK